MENKMPDLNGQPEFSEQNRKQLEDNLLSWYNFYQKCHELEESEPFDDALSISKDIRSKYYRGCITDRQVIFTEYDRDEYYEDKIKPQVVISYKKSHPDLKSKYEKLIEKSKPINDDIDREAQQKVSVLYRVLLVINIILTLGTSIGVGVGVGIASESIFLGILIGVASAIIVSFIISFRFVVKRANILRMYKERKTIIPDETQWYQEQETYVSFEKEIHDKYEIMMNRYETALQQSIIALRGVKAELQQTIPIPIAYSDEYHIQQLLVVVHNGRADTLKEAINLIETEAYRSNVLQSLDNLNSNLKQIKAISIDGFTTLSQQNMAIHRKLQNIQIDQQAIFAANQIVK